MNLSIPRAIKLLYPVYPNEIKVADVKNVIYTPYQGFMGPCCHYQVNKERFILLEEKITDVNPDEVTDFKSVSIDSKDGETELTIQYVKQ
ncbi:hypothetical protein [Ohtaekwangia koreensis]|uniref:Uncharacterized protein n=1 Tax=Ohtaekwangia koreensis TaxID=688867 RepID=A0A1T5M0Y8_9BACT|nr:hypothetical protein [Ohtaekwangia koreensis]SKC81892.1 hypothetical protein SAMN05660236_4042 [Ohtaekwangia koreensis]